MQLVKYGLLLASVVALVGCEVRGPSLKLEPAKIRIDGVKVDGGSSKGKFCPPGQAKKGNC